MTYRPAIPADADRIATLHARSWQETYRGILPDSYLADEVEADRLMYWQEHFRIDVPGRYVLIAETDGELAGFACTVANDDPVYGALLDNLHVAAAHKGSGIGRALMKQAAEWVQQQQPDSPLYLWVYEKNRAARILYEHLGALNKEAVMGDYAVVLRYVWPDLQTLITACSRPVTTGG